VTASKSTSINPRAQTASSTGQVCLQTCYKRT